MNNNDDIELKSVLSENMMNSITKDDKNTPIKNIFNQSVNYMKEKMKYKNKKNITKYEAIKSPFSIIDEEDDDDNYDGEYSYEADQKDLEDNENDIEKDNIDDHDLSAIL